MDKHGILSRLSLSRLLLTLPMCPAFRTHARTYVTRLRALLLLPWPPCSFPLLQVSYPLLLLLNLLLLAFYLCINICISQVLTWISHRHRRTFLMRFQHLRCFERRQLRALNLFFLHLGLRDELHRVTRRVFLSSSLGAYVWSLSSMVSVKLLGDAGEHVPCWCGIAPSVSVP